MERWEVLKNTAIARCAARVYCSVALALLLRVQLSMLAGQMYLETVRKRRKVVSKSVQEKYMELCQVFIARGCEEVCDLIFAKVCELNVSLKERVSIAEVEDVFQCVMKSLAASVRPRKCLLRPDLADCSMLGEEESATIGTLFDDTADLLDTDDFAGTVDHCVQQCLALLFDSFAAELSAHHEKNNKNGFVGLAEIRLPFARWDIISFQVLVHFRDLCWSWIIPKSIDTKQVVSLGKKYVSPSKIFFVAQNA